MGTKQIIITLVWCLASSVYRSNAQELPIKAYDLSNNSVDILGQNGIFILKNSKNCFSCFTQIYTAATRISDKYGIPLAFITHIDSSVYARKSENAVVRRAFANTSNVYFDYSNEEEPMGYSTKMRPNSIFYTFSVDVSPSLLIVFDRKHLYLPYNKLFNGTEVNSDWLDRRTSEFILNRQ